MSFNLNFDVTPKSQSTHHLDFTLIVPTHLRLDPIQVNSSLSALSPTNSNLQATTGFFDSFNKCCDVVKRFFYSCFSCFGLFSRPVVSNNEHLVAQDDEIQRRLIKQLQHANDQMRQESTKPFRYSFAPAQWSTHEERIGDYSVGVCHAQGRRPTMEDEHLAVQFNLSIGGRNYPVHLFGIFDGHGGPEASRYLRDHLHEKLNQALLEFNPNGLTDAGIWRALKMTFVRLDRDFGNAKPDAAKVQGSTATVAMILDNKLWTANVGDSRTVLDDAGTPIQLTEDAKPGDPRYKKNIEKRGGQVVNVLGVPRINEILAVGRALGDHQLGSAINPRPKISVKPLSDIQQGSHLILCCDGIYDVARTQDVVSKVHQFRLLSAGVHANNLVYSAYQSGSGDNLSALVVKVK